MSLRSLSACPELLLVRTIPLSVLLVFAGCGIGPSPTAVMSNAASGLRGVAHGGQQPIANATVRLIMPGHGSYNQMGTTLAQTATDTAGQFSLPAYTCPAGAGVVYLQVDGGDSGSGVNSRISEAALLGDCTTLTPTTFVVVSEVTTVAAAYAMAQFASVSVTAVSIGAPPTNLVGLNNSFGAANNLADFATGNARSANDIAGLVLPTAEMNTLGNILAACVNSSGSVTGTTPCSTLFAATGIPTGWQGATTFGAALAIAQSPGMNAATLFGLTTASAPFQPTLTSAPPDFAVAIEYNGGGIDASGGTQGVALDASGNAWISTGYNPSANPAVHRITEISPAGVYLSGASGFGSASIVAPFGIAVDRNGSVVVADAYGNKVVKLNSGGSVTQTGTVPSFHNPNGLAYGSDSNVSLYVTNAAGSQTSRLDPGTFAELTAGPYSTGQFGVGVASNTFTIWTANYTAKTIAKIDWQTNLVSTYPTASSPSAMALDAGFNAWTTLHNSVAKYSSAGVLQTNTSAGAFATNTTMHIPQDIAIDGLSRAWVSNYRGYPNSGSLIQVAYDGTLISSNDGYTANGAIISGPSVPGGIAIDMTGNVWIAGDNVADASGANSLTGNFVSEVIGIATPVMTPRIAQVLAGEVGVRP